MAANDEMRRNGGASTTDQRTGRSSVNEINALILPQRQSAALPTVAARGAIAGQRGRGEYDSSSAASSGIASPLTEPSASAREYWPGGLTSSDGLFVLPAIKVLTLTDANGAEVEVQLANPAGAA